MFKNILLFIVLLVSLSACSPKLTKTTDAPTQAVALNKILFLNLEVSKSDSAPTFKVVSHQTVDGKIKRPAPTKLNVQQYFRLVFNNADGKTINEIAIENPLTKAVEVPSENGILTRQKLDLDKAPMAIRIQYLNKISSITVFDETGKLISTLEVSI